ncbi:MAG: AlkA N-terminal domain-containing protein [Ornithinibacter sp.]
MTTSPDVDDTCDLPALRSYLVAHAIPGVDEIATLEEGSTAHRRTLTVGGRDVRVQVTLPTADLGVPGIRVQGPPDAVAEATVAARRWLGLDLDPRAAVGALRRDPVIGSLVHARPWLRVPGAADPFEAAVFVVLGQHVSLAAGRAFAGRLVAAHGGFPSAEVLAVADPATVKEVVGVTGARAHTLVALANEVASGILPLALAPRSQEHPAGSGGNNPQNPRGAPDSARIREGLLALPGIGPWTADLIALRCLRDPDVFLPGDLVLRKALGGITAREAARVAQAWRPHRSLAVLHLWTHHALLPER